SNTPYDSLFVEQIIVDLGYPAHVDPTQYESCTSIERFQRRRYYLTGRSENDRPVKPHRRLGKCIAYPGSTELFSERLVFATITSCDINVRPARSRNLNAYVTCRAKAINAEAGTIPC